MSSIDPELRRHIIANRPLRIPHVTKVVSELSKGVEAVYSYGCDITVEASKILSECKDKPIVDVLGKRYYVTMKYFNPSTGRVEDMKVPVEECSMRDY